MFSDKTAFQRNEAFNRAYCDLIFLLDRNYPKKSALTFVANHYTLDSNYRNILNRAAIPSDIVRIIKTNLIKDPKLIRGRHLHVDTYNQLTTLYSIINHDPVIICRDGVLRDIFSSLHTKKDLKIDRELLSPFFKSLVKLEPKYICFYFDKQRSSSKIHANYFSRLFQEFSISGSCEIHKAVDWILKTQTEEVVLSHDTEILKVVPNCFDFLSWFFNLTFPHTLSQQFSIDFLNLSCF